MNEKSEKWRRKLHSHLRRLVYEQVTADYTRTLFSYIRCYIEVSDSRGKFRFLAFFADWLQHVELNRASAYQMLCEWNLYVLSVTGRDSTEPPVSDQFMLDALVEEFVRIVEISSKGGKYSIQQYKLEQIVTYLMAEILDTPLVAPKNCPPITSFDGRALYRLELCYGRLYWGAEAEVFGYKAVLYLQTETDPIKLVFSILPDPCKNCGLRFRECSLPEGPFILPGCNKYKFFLRYPYGKRC